MSKDDAAIAEPLLTTLRVERLIVKNLPQIDHHQEIVEEIKPDAIRVRLPYKSKYMGSELWQDGAGQVFSGPMVMGFADTSMYSCVIAAMGPNVIPVMATSTLLSCARQKPATWLLKRELFVVAGDCTILNAG